jgi:riboflavin synthase
MFTGLIESVGTIESVGRGSLVVTAPFARELSVGDSIAVNGVCLTAVETDNAAFTAQLSPETLRATSLGRLTAGSRVNLERAVRADQRLGGHFVLGHVDTTAAITKWEPQGDHWWLEMALPTPIEAWVVEKGSIAVDGISLTIARLSADAIGIQIVPHTRSHTNLSDRRLTDIVNLEADIIGKYAARLRSLA